MDYDNTPTIVTLSPNADGNNSIQAVSFEEAFGEQSNLFGKGRARRKKRRLERIKNRGEVKAARRANRLAKVQDRVERRKTRKQGRVDKRAIGKDEDPEENDTQATNGQDQDSDNTSDSPSQSSSSDDSQSSPDDNGMSDVGSDLDPDGESDGGDDDSEESEFAGGTGDSSREFMGEEANSEFAGESEQKHPVNPKVKSLAKKIEINSYIIHCLKQQLGKGGDDATLTQEIQRREANLKELDNVVDAYSEARGGKHGGGGHAARKEVRAARKEARKELHAEVKAKRAEKRAIRKGTNVDADLDPQISEDSVVVPAEEAGSSFNGTGIIAIDQENDFDAPETRAVEVKSSFSGSDIKNWPWTKIFIGVAIAGTALYILKKKKII